VDSTIRKASLQCVFRDSGHAPFRHTLRDMTLQHMKFALTAIWMIGVVWVLAISGYLRSMSDIPLLAVLSAAPPAAMWLLWNEPVQTASERLQSVHGTVDDKKPRRWGAGAR
jgi:hypothetical protein